MHIIPKGWSKFQHYKDRAPTWIKLHADLLDDFDFHCLPVASRALAPMLWLLASKYEGGKIPHDLVKLSFRLRMSEKDLSSAIKPLIDNGFFILGQDASNALAECEQDACLEKRREETEKETDTPEDDGKPKRDKSSLTCADLITQGVDKDVAESFLLLRKTRRSPVTQLVVDQIAKEAATVGKTLSQALATCVARGWQGYKAEWDSGATVQPQQPASPGYKPFIPSSQRGQS